MNDKFVKNILDVPGVEGVCVFDREGRVIENQLPSFFVEELFEDMARRVLSLYETIDENFVPCDEYLLKYNERWLFIRRGTGIFLLVLAIPAVNRVSLKMVTNLAIKNIKVSRLGSASPSSAPHSSATPPESAAPSQPVAPAPNARPDATPSPSGARKRVPRPRPARTYRGGSY